MAVQEDLLGLDLVRELKRVNALNSKLVNGIVIAAAAGVIGIVFGLISALSRPEPVRLATDAQGRAYPVASLTANDPPDAKVTKVAGECIYYLLNHSFHNFQNTFEKAVGECVTGGGTVGIRKAADPLLARMRADKLNMSSQFVIFPFINSRSDVKGRRVYHVQGVVSVGYRGTDRSVPPIEYVFSSDVTRVPYDSHIEGLRMENLVLQVRGNEMR
jgi:hypothetical protein